MGDPKKILELKQVVFDAGIVAADTVLVAADQDVDDCTGYAPAYRDWETDRKSTRLNSSHSAKSRMPSSA